MANNPADTADRTDKNPAHQTGEDQGVIKAPQQTDAQMAGKDLPRGSEKETHARK
ncbi:hypothetical protein [Novosphingobium sp. JCM 18896]|uniref:hypothetical protein n=1 Tax=Novosphingobium sp. JCM 18896 TaxID=2989731 RepID=UPI0022212F5E|nr:hypothetical protein [Novosphingobium sp. JCM 18896]MCW1430052.1 hypothetical protein [Novosphingobium sp. JCM 18896]